MTVVEFVVELEGGATVVVVVVVVVVGKELAMTWE